MADAMDLAQQREQEDRERHINNARSRIAAPSVFSAKNVTHQSRKLAALRFRA
jgi:hypothetical protein